MTTIKRFSIKFISYILIIILDYFLLMYLIPHPPIKAYLIFSFSYMFLSTTVFLIFKGEILKVYSEIPTRRVFMTEYSLSHKKIILPIDMWRDIKRLLRSMKMFNIKFLPLALVLISCERLFIVISLQYVLFTIVVGLFKQLYNKGVRLSVRNFELPPEKRSFLLIYYFLFNPQKYSPLRMVNVFYLISLSSLLGISTYILKRICVFNEKLNEATTEYYRKSPLGKMRIIFILILEDEVLERGEALLIENGKIHFNPFGVIESLIKNLRTAAISRSIYLSQSDYILPSKEEINQITIKDSLIMKDFYDKKKNIPHLTIIILQNRFSRPDLWNFYRAYIATSQARIKTTSGYYSSVRVWENGGRTQFLVNSCDTVDKIFDSSCYSDPTRSKEILKAQNRSIFEIWQVGDIQSYINARIRGKMEFLHQSEDKIVSIYDRTLTQIAQETGYKDYDELLKWRRNQIDVEVDHLLKGERGDRKAHAFLYSLGLLVSKHGTSGFDFFFKSLNSEDLLKQEEAFLILKEFDRDEGVQAFSDIIDA